MVKRLAIMVVLATTPTLAQEPAKPNVEEVSTQANSAIRALRAQRDEANDRIVRAQIEIDRLTKELEAVKAAKQEQK